MRSLSLAERQRMIDPSNHATRLEHPLGAIFRVSLGLVTVPRDLTIFQLQIHQSKIVLQKV